MQISDKDMAAIVADATSNLKTKLSAELSNRLEYQVLNAAQDQVAEYVRAWVAENILPDIGAVLTESKEGLVSTALAVGEGLTKSISEMMVEAVTKNLENSYHRNKVFEALFRS